MINKAIEKLQIIQARLKAPKSQWNDFSKYYYRNCEDILNAVKPLLTELQAVVVLTDEVVNIGDRYYVKATAKLIDCENGNMFESTAFAREDETKKGMDLSQITGACSSYARKYALNGLFAIDDTKDADNFNNNEKAEKKVEKPKQTEKTKTEIIMEIVKTQERFNKLNDWQFKQTQTEMNDLNDVDFGVVKQKAIENMKKYE